MQKRCSAVLLLFVLFLAPSLWAQTPPAFSGLVVFGDSLSDDGNVANVAAATYGIRYPSGPFNYDDGRFTDGTGTNPPARNFTGLWHEQLASTLNLPIAKPSKEGGTDYAYGSATTQDGTQVVSAGFFSITIENMGLQVDDYLKRAAPPDPKALHVVWGGANDIIRDSSDASVAATADRVTALVERLARAGAVNFLVPNIPPVGDVPDHSGSGQLNSAAASYRDRLNADLDSLQVRLTGAGIPLHLYRMDIYGLYISLVTNPSARGFTNVTDKAQGTSGINPDTYLFWDGLHPTTGGHHQIALEAYKVLSAPASMPGSDPIIGAVVNGASLSGSIASGTWVTIFGSNLAQTTRIWANPDFVNGKLPTMLDGVSVMIDGKPAYVYYISPTQLNVLAPSDAATGNVSVQVTTSAGVSLASTVNKAPAAPAFFQFDPQSRKYIAAVYPNGTYAGPVGLFGAALATRPGKPGEIIELYATGLGATSPPYPDGQILTTNYPLAVPPTAKIGGQPATILYAGLVSPGLYQLNVVIPALPDGDQSVVIDLGGGVQSAMNTSFIAVKN